MLHKSNVLTIVINPSLFSSRIQSYSFSLNHSFWYLFSGSNGLLHFNKTLRTAGEGNHKYAYSVTISINYKTMLKENDFSPSSKFFFVDRSRVYAYKFKLLVHMPMCDECNR